MENIALVTIKIPVGGTKKPFRPVVLTSRSQRTRSDKLSSPPPSEVLSIQKNTTFTRSGPPPNDATLGVKFISAGTAACIADLATFPLDTAKVRLQIQGEGLAAAATARSGAVAYAGTFTTAAAGRAAIKAATPKYRGLVNAVATISKEEGVRALYNGLVPGLQRQMCFASVRIGTYDVVKQQYAKMLKVDPTQKNIGVRILAGVTTGAAAVLVAQPTDVVKVRMQAQSKGNKRYNGCISAYRKIALKEGVRGLWKGTVPNMSRNAVVNCTELVSYDLIKEAILSNRLLSDSLPCHFLSAVGAGFCTTVLASPIDVVKTRFMNSSEGVYKGAMECASKMYKEGGVRTFYKGAVPAFLRFGPWNVVMFVSYEQLKRLFVNYSDQAPVPGAIVECEKPATPSKEAQKEININKKPSRYI